MPLCLYGFITLLKWLKIKSCTMYIWSDGVFLRLTCETHFYYYHTALLCVFLSLNGKYQWIMICWPSAVAAVEWCIECWHWNGETFYRWSSVLIKCADINGSFASINVGCQYWNLFSYCSMCCPNLSVLFLPFLTNWVNIS